MATRCRWPPESDCGQASERSQRGRAARAASAPRARPLRTRPGRRGASVQFSSTGGAGRARTTGTPSPPGRAAQRAPLGGDLEVAERNAGPHRTARARRGSGAAWSCRSRSVPSTTATPAGSTRRLSPPAPGAAARRASLEGLDRPARSSRPPARCSPSRRSTQRESRAKGRPEQQIAGADQEPEAEVIAHGRGERAVGLGELGQGHHRDQRAVLEQRDEVVGHRRQRDPQRLRADDVAERLPAAEAQHPRGVQLARGHAASSPAR